MKMKNNLDEMQEQELLKIEHNGCWLAFWLLLISLIVQSIAFGAAQYKIIAGEWIVFMILALYLAIACARKGIWDRKIPMTNKANLVVSLIAAVGFGAFNAVMIFKNYHKPVGTVIAAAVTAVITFIICFAALTVTMKQAQRRKAILEAEPADADEI